MFGSEVSCEEVSPVVQETLVGGFYTASHLAGVGVLPPSGYSEDLCLGVGFWPQPRAVGRAVGVPQNQNPKHCYSLQDLEMFQEKAWW